MACLCLLFCLFLLTFELGHTGAIGDTDCTAKILELSKTLVKLKSFIEEMSGRLETEVRLREQLEERVRRSQICQKEEDNVTDGGSDVIVSEPSLKTLTKEKRSSGIRSSNGTIAFSAYLTTALSSPGNLRTLIFDAIFTNEGNGYNHHIGVFIAPRTGLYVFTWTIRTSSGYFNTQLLVNGLIYGWVYSASNYHYDSSSATAVVRVVAGQSVYIRTGPANNGGTIYSGNEGFSTFSGWTVD
eukprot:XP_011415918.1 PREDICTED: complement C1q tumor necrosis factor-related protein 2 [Crassostrea gigas]